MLPEAATRYHHGPSEDSIASSPQLLIEIVRDVSRERLKRYLAATAQNLEDAVSLYEQNVALSEMTFGFRRKRD
jgi:hypothetical protein